MPNFFRSIVCLFCIAFTLYGVVPVIKQRTFKKGEVVLELQVIPSTLTSITTNPVYIDGITIVNDSASDSYVSLQCNGTGAKFISAVKPIPSGTTFSTALAPLYCSTGFSMQLVSGTNTNISMKWME